MIYIPFGSPVDGCGRESVLGRAISSSRLPEPRQRARSLLAPSALRITSGRRAVQRDPRPLRRLLDHERRLLDHAEAIRDRHALLGPHLPELVVRDALAVEAHDVRLGRLLGRLVPRGAVRRVAEDVDAGDALGTAARPRAPLGVDARHVLARALGEAPPQQALLRAQRLRHRPRTRDRTAAEAAEAAGEAAGGGAARLAVLLAVGVEVVVAHLALALMGVGGLDDAVLVPRPHVVQDLGDEGLPVDLGARALGELVRGGLSGAVTCGLCERCGRRRSEESHRQTWRCKRRHVGEERQRYEPADKHA